MELSKQNKEALSELKAQITKLVVDYQILSGLSVVSIEPINIQSNVTGDYKTISVNVVIN